MPHGPDRADVSTVVLGAAPGEGAGVGAGAGAGKGVGVTVVPPATLLTVEPPPQAVRAPASTAKDSAQAARKANRFCSGRMAILRVKIYIPHHPPNAVKQLLRQMVFRDET